MSNRCSPITTTTLKRRINRGPTDAGADPIDKSRKGARHHDIKMLERKIDLGTTHREFGKNNIRTSKYTYLTFVPLNLLEQFKKIANCYFLGLTLMQMIDAITISEGLPTILAPLTFVIFVSMLKDFLEDFKRKSADAEENNSKVLKWDFHKKEFVTDSWKHLITGDYIKVCEDQSIAADLLVLYTSNKKKDCFVMTKNLDGETNLKPKEVPVKLKPILNKEETIVADTTSSQFRIEAPNPNIDSFAGSLLFRNEPISINQDNIVLRGCTLKNTDHIIGVVTFVGPYTKIMQNSVKTKPKKSDLERKMQNQIFMVFGMVGLFCIIASFLYILWFSRFKGYVDYLGLGDLDLLLEFFIRIGNWILIFGNFVPISLLVTIESVKFIQAMFISADESMYTSKCDSKVIVQSSNLNEELGQISYVFSDKTGTLTCNEMVFKKCIVEGEAYGEVSDHNILTKFKPIDNVEFTDPNFMTNLNTDRNLLYCKFLAICHSIITDLKEGNLVYNSSSPDEIALANFARFCGTEYRGIDEMGNMDVYICGQDRKFKRHYVLEFNSDRKRQSVLFEEENGDVWLYTKGADNIMLQRTKTEYLKKKEVKQLQFHLDQFAKEGLRTLVLGVKKIKPDEWKNWKKRYDEAINLIEGREEAMLALQAEIEIDLYIIGATAIEDKLQDQVPETIYQLKRAGVRVWVLTGDKVETAITIGHSCNLLQHDMVTYEIVKSDVDDIKSNLNQAYENIAQSLKTGVAAKRGIIVSGGALLTIFQDTELKKKLNVVAQSCEAVLCCRVTPLQKQEVVKMVMECVPLARTLSIGDGANDVQMITAAHVGVGIKGVEGQQAARASDYAIGEFKHLRKLVFYYGRESYRKNTILVLYSFYKNIVLVLPQFWYAVLFQNLSGVTLYDAFLYQFVNILYTSAPIVIYAVFDRDTDVEVIEKSPKYFFPGPKFLFFNATVFWQWFAFGVIHAFIITLISSLANYGPQEDGNYLGFWGYGILAFTGAVLVPTVKVISFSYSYHALNIGVLIGSMSLFILSFFLINNMPTNEHFGIFFKVYFNLKTILMFTIMIIATNHVDNMWTKFQYAVLFKGAAPPSSSKPLIEEPWGYDENQVSSKNADDIHVASLEKSEENKRPSFY